MKSNVKLTVVFRGTYQDGMNHWSDYTKTGEIKLTEEQTKLFSPPTNMSFSELIVEFGVEDTQ